MLVDKGVQTLFEDYYETFIVSQYSYLSSMTFLEMKKALKTF